MKPGQIIAAVIALFFVVELLVGDESGVLSNLQENSGQVATAEVQPGTAATPISGPASTAATGSNPWDVSEDSLPVDAGDFAELEVPANEDPVEQTIPVKPRAQSQPRPGSPEFPYVPLPKPQLTVAGPQINYPPVAER